MQHRAARLVPNLKKKCYEDRLRTLKLTTLDIRRKRVDLIEFYKILNGLKCVVWKKQGSIGHLIYRISTSTTKSNINDLERNEKLCSRSIL